MKKLIAGLLVAALLAGCAARTAYREGRELVAQGRVPEGLARMDEAVRLEPGSAEYRLAALQARERFVLSQVDKAEGLRAQGRHADAEKVFREVLAVHGSNDRALAGLRAVDQDRRLDGWLREAEAAAAKKDVESARTKLRAVLLEQPTHERARAQLQRLDEAQARPAAEATLAAAYRKPITIEFKDVAIRTVFEVLSRTSGLNFLFDKDVKTDQRTSIFLKNATVEAAVNLTLLTNQLEQRVLDANTVLVYPNTQAKQKDYQPLTVRSFHLANAEAKTVAATLKAILKTRDLVVDDKLNLLIVRDSPEAIRLAEKLVAVHDVPEPEVMLEVEILEVKRTRLLDLGIRWPDQLGLAPIGAGAGGALTVADLRNLDGSRVSASVGGVTLNAKNTDSDANILANPRIRARNREKARILIGERVPVITTTSTTIAVTESVNYVDVGLKLDVEPTIYLDGEVAIKVALEVSNIISQLQTKSGTMAYQIGTRTAQTVLRLKDGENQVLAGLINDEDRRSANKVPALGDVPLVGRLFGSRLDDASKTEIVLSITPRIVRNVRRPNASLVEFDSGTENSIGARPHASPTPPATPANSPSAAAAARPAIEPTPGAVPAPSAPAAPAGSPVIQPDAGAQNAAAVPSTPSALRVRAPSQVKAGDIFAMQLVMEPNQPIASIPLGIAFDPATVQVVSVVEGDFLRQGGAQSTFVSRVDPKGQILVTGTRAGSSGAAAGGLFATVNLRATATANTETRLQVLTVAPVGLGGRTVPTSLPAPHVLRVGH